jgi:diaminohydroxyphosphoribosylaminopyrimidine deaminase / 5-amino-6-(5-phosphoribosylamino)uracil reductase
MIWCRLMRRLTLIPSLTETVAGRKTFLRKIVSEEEWMDRALVLANRGLALAHPNPRVGAVIVKDGKVVGEGFHTYDGMKHAERIALERAGAKARGATLYINLEPCCHFGRTGPCSDAIIAAGIRRVVAAMKDPNRLVAGHGFRQLKRAGVRIEVGVRDAEARRLNEDFVGWIRARRPFVILKSALTLDGRIAERAGTATAITGAASLAAVQKWRHASDAILTGIGTVLADDPLLTDRSGSARRRRLLRVVIDSRLRIPLRSRLVRSAREDLLVFTLQSATSAKARALTKAGVEVLTIRSRGGRVDLKEVIRELGRREILSVLLEAGPALNGAAIEAGIVDKMILFYAPKFIGERGVPMAILPAGWFRRGRELRIERVERFGEDFAVEGYFHDVYGNHRARRTN